MVGATGKALYHEVTCGEGEKRMCWRRLLHKDSCFSLLYERTPWEEGDLQKPFQKPSPLQKNGVSFLPPTLRWGEIPDLCSCALQASNNLKDAYRCLISQAKCGSNHCSFSYLCMSQLCSLEVSLLSLAAGFPMCNMKTIISSQLISEFQCMDVTKFCPLY